MTVTPVPYLTGTNHVLHREPLVAVCRNEEDVWVLQVRGRLQDLVERDVAVEAHYNGAHFRVQTDVVQATVKHVTLHDVWLKGKNSNEPLKMSLRKHNMSAYNGNCARYCQ